VQTWVRLEIGAMCGSCRKVYATGDPMLVIEIPNVKVKKLRGPCCAGDAPPDLPVLETVQRFTKPMRKLKTIAESALPRDFKILQGGRENA
jgi:hypothetical protein